jgi:hypothetical protein
MSTDQVAGKNVDGRSDVFAVGIVLYELLAGRRPFQGDNIAAVMKAILEDTPQALTAIVPALDPRIWAAVQKALNKNPDDRPWSASEFAHDLQLVRYTDAVQLGEGAEPTQVRLPIPVPPSPGPPPEPATGPAPQPSRPFERTRPGSRAQVSSGPGRKAPAQSVATIEPPSVPTANPRHPPAPHPAPRPPLPRPPSPRRRGLWAGVAAALLVAVVATPYWWRADPEYRFEVRSNPDGAMVVIDDVDSGQRTPARFVLASRPARVTLKMDGYHSAEAQMPVALPEAPIEIRLQRVADVSPPPVPAPPANDPGTPQVLPPVPVTPDVTGAGDTAAMGTVRRPVTPDKPSTIDVKTPVMVRLTGGYPFEITGCERTLPASSEHEFEVRAPCTLRLRSSRYLLDREVPVTVSSGQFVDAAPQLARVQLRTAREKCQIVVDGRAVGTQPVDLELASGRHHIVVHCDGRNYDIPDFMVEPGNSIRRLDDFLP